MSIVNRALVWLGVEGADKAERDFQKVGEAGKKAGADIEGAFKKVGVALGQFGASVVDAVVDVKQLDPAALTRTMEDYSRALTRTSIATGQSLDGLKSRYMDLAKANAVMPQQIDAFAKSMGRMTYDIKGAQDAFTGLHNAALASGDTVEDWKPFGAMLHNVKGIAGDTTKEVGKLFAQADKLKTVGGPKALRDLFVDIAPAIDVAISRLGRARAEAFSFVGILTEGLPKAQASRIAGATIGTFGSQWKDISRTVGHDVLGPDGQYKNFPKVAAELIGLMRRPVQAGGRGQSEEQILLAFRDWLGPEAGTRMYQKLSSGAFRGIGALTDIDPSGAAAAAGSAYRGSRIGQIDNSRIEMFGVESQVGDWFVDLKAAASRLISEHPVAAMGLSAAAAAGGKAALSKVLPALGAKLAIPALKGAGGLLGAGLSVLPVEDIFLPDSMQNKAGSRSEMSDAPLAELLKERALSGKTGSGPDALYESRAGEISAAESALAADLGKGADAGVFIKEQSIERLAEALRMALEHAAANAAPPRRTEADKQPASKN